MRVKVKEGFCDKELLHSFVKNIYIFRKKSNYRCVLCLRNHSPIGIIGHFRQEYPKTKQISNSIAAHTH